MSYRGTLVVLMALALLTMITWQSGSMDPIDEVAIAEERMGRVLDSRLIDVSGSKDDNPVMLHVVQAGPVDGPAVVLLHGFPEFWFSWHRQIADLADNGYRVIVPDLRGYNRSSKPGNIDSYQIEVYAQDIARMLDALNIEHCFVAGHDVGATITWHLVYAMPQRIKRAIVFSSIHPLAQRSLPEQVNKYALSFYFDYFRIPFIPELIGRAGNWYLLTYSLRKTAAVELFDPNEVNIYKSAWARENSFTTMMNYYRAAVPNKNLDLYSKSNNVPVKIYYGGEDVYFPQKYAQKSADFIGVENVNEWPGVGHWVLLEAPAQTSLAMIDFFKP